MKLIRNNFIAILAGVIYLSKAIWFILKNPNFILMWDWPGHLEKARVATWPWNGGWDNFFWGGYPTWLYPNIFHILLKGFIGLTKNQSMGTGILVLLILIGQIIGLRLLIKKLFKNSRDDRYRIIQNLAFTGTLIYMGEKSAGALMGSFLGTLMVGGGPGALGTAILFFLLATDSWMASGILLGILLLTHPLTAPVGIIYLSFKFVEAFLANKTHRLISLKWIGALVIGAVIGLPWILPSTDTSTSNVALHFPAQQIDHMVWILAIVIFSVLETGKKFRALRWTAIAIGILSALPEIMVKNMQNWSVNYLGFRGIPFYRLEWFLWIIAIPLIFAWLSWHKNFIGWINKLKTAPFLLLTLFLLTMLFLETKIGVTAKLNFNFENIDNTGTTPKRVMNISRDAAPLNYPQAMEHELVRKAGYIGSTRWFYESGAQGYFYNYLKKMIEPGSFTDGTADSVFLDQNQKPIFVKDKDKLARLLGVNYAVFTSLGEPEESENVVKIGSFDVKNGKSPEIKINYFMMLLNEEPLAIALKTIPNYNSDINVMDWWSKGEIETLVTDEDYPRKQDLNLDQPEIKDIKIEPTKISFFVEGNKPAPIFVKFSYSPYYEAKALDSHSQVSKPYWITPGNLLVYGYGNIELEWKTPWYMKVYGPISVVALVIFSLVAILKRSDLARKGRTLKNQI